MNTSGLFLANSGLFLAYCWPMPAAGLGHAEEVGGGEDGE